MDYKLTEIQRELYKSNNRDNGLDFLRLICYFMLSAYHFFNYYGAHFINPGTNGFNAYIIQNLGWGGGRMICNVFLFISAYYLCEKKNLK